MILDSVYGAPNAMSTDQSPMVGKISTRCLSAPAEPSVAPRLPIETKPLRRPPVSTPDYVSLDNGLIRRNSDPQGAGYENGEPIEQLRPVLVDCGQSVGCVFVRIIFW